MSAPLGLLVSAPAPAPAAAAPLVPAAPGTAGSFAAVMQGTLDAQAAAVPPGTLPASQPASGLPAGVTAPAGMPAATLPAATLLAAAGLSAGSGSDVHPDAEADSRPGPDSGAVLDGGALGVALPTDPLPIPAAIPAPIPPAPSPAAQAPAAQAPTLAARSAEQSTPATTATVGAAAEVPGRGLRVARALPDRTDAAPPAASAAPPATIVLPAPALPATSVPPAMPAAGPAATVSPALTVATIAAVSTAGKPPTAPKEPVDAPIAAPGAAPAALAPGAPAPAAQATPAAPAQAAPAQAAPLATQVFRPIFSLSGAQPGQHVLTISITPDNLGPVTVQAHVTGENIRVELFAPTDLARDALRAILPDLRRDLAGSGMNATLDLSSQNQAADPGAARQGRAQPDPRAEPGREAAALPERATLTPSYGTSSTIDVLA